MSLSEHKIILEKFLSIDGEVALLLKQLEKISSERLDCTALATLSLSHIKNILNKYIVGDLSTEELERWANLIEGYDDIEYDHSANDRIKEIIHALANPELNTQLTISNATILLNNL